MKKWNDNWSNRTDLPYYVRCWEYFMISQKLKSTRNSLTAERSHWSVHSKLATSIEKWISITELIPPSNEQNTADGISWIHFIHSKSDNFLLTHHEIECENTWTTRIMNCNYQPRQRNKYDNWSSDYSEVLNETWY